MCQVRIWLQFIIPIGSLLSVSINDTNQQKDSPTITLSYSMYLHQIRNANFSAGKKIFCGQSFTKYDDRLCK